MAENTLFCSRCGAPNITSATFCQKCGANLGPALAVAPAVGYSQAATAAGYGGFWIRFVAFIIDAIILSFATWPIRMMFFMSMGGRSHIYTIPMGPHDIHRMAPFLVALPALWGTSGFGELAL